MAIQRVKQRPFFPSKNLCPLVLVTSGSEVLSRFWSGFPPDRRSLCSPLASSASEVAENPYRVPRGTDSARPLRRPRPTARPATIGGSAPCCPCLPPRLHRQMERILAAGPGQPASSDTPHLCICRASSSVQRSTLAAVRRGSDMESTERR
jgi:hypothetical protein